MAVIDDLRSFGANVEEGLNRCVNNEDFYLKMVRKAAEDSSFDELKSAVEEKDFDRAFELAHALKGVAANLALTPISEPISEAVELLRSRTDTDYSGYIAAVIEKRDELKKLLQ